MPPRIDQSTAARRLTGAGRLAWSEPAWGGEDPRGETRHHWAKRRGLKAHARGGGAAE